MDQASKTILRLRGELAEAREQLGKEQIKNHLLRHKILDIKQVLEDE